MMTHIQYYFYKLNNSFISFFIRAESKRPNKITSSDEYQREALALSGFRDHKIFLALFFTIDSFDKIKLRKLKIEILIQLPQFW